MKEESPNMSNSILDVEFTAEDKIFLEDLKEHSKLSGSSFKMLPMFLNNPVNLHALYQTVLGLGGYHKFCESSYWKMLTPPGESASKASPLICSIYEKYLLRYERDHFPGYAQTSKENCSPKSQESIETLNSELSGSSDTINPSNLSLVNGKNIHETSVDEDLSKYFLGALDKKWLYESDRIALALESELPNEIEWALASLADWSKSCPPEFLLENFPLLASQLQKQFESHSKNLEAALRNGKGNLVGEAFLLITLSIRNFSFIKENAKYLADSTTLAKNIFKVISIDFPISPLISTFGYPELQSYCIDLLDNLGTFISPPQSFFNWLFNAIIGTDRSLLLGSLKILSRLSLGECLDGVEKIIADGKIIKHILNLLVLPSDLELKNASAEFLLLLSYFVPSELSNCISSLSHNVIKILVQLVLDSLTPPQSRSIQKQTLQVRNNISASLAFEKWLRATCVLSSKDMVSPRDLYRHYSKEQQVNEKLVFIPSENFVLLILKTFPWCQIVRRISEGRLAIFIQGLSRSGSKTQTLIPEKNVYSAPRGALPREYTCLWGNCGAKLKNKAFVLSHIRGVHLAAKSASYTCEWQFCSMLKSNTSRPLILSHFQKHHFTDMQPSYQFKSHARVSEIPEPVQEESNEAEQTSLLMDLLKKLSSLDQLQKCFFTLQDMLFQISIIQPSLSNDIFFILENINSLANEENKPE